MSIIDDALKQVQHKQGKAEPSAVHAGLPKPTMARLLPVVVVGLLAVAAAGWWFVGDASKDSDLASLGEVGVNPAAPALPGVISPSEPIEIRSTADISATNGGSGSAELAALTEGGAEPAGVADLDEVRSGGRLSELGQQVQTLTSSAVDPSSEPSDEQPLAGEQLALVGLTQMKKSTDVQSGDSSIDLNNGMVSALTAAAEELPSGDARNSAVARLTEVAAVAAVESGEVADLTVSSAEVVGEAGSPVSTLTATDPQTSEIDPDLTGLTALDSGSGADMGLPTGSGDELDSASDDDSVAGLTDLTGEEGALAEGGRLEALSGVEGLTADEPTEALGYADQPVAPSETSSRQVAVEVSRSGDTQSIAPMDLPIVPVVTLTRGEIDTRLRAARADERAGNYRAALQRLVGIGATTLDVSLLKARLHARAGEFELSNELFLAIGESSLDAEASFWLGYGRFSLQQWQPAVMALQRAASLNSSDVLSSLYLGLALQQVGDYRGSIDAFHHVRNLQPDMPEVAFNTGISWWALGEKQRAYGAFHHFMRITDGQREAYANQRRRVSQDYQLAR